MHSNPYFSSAPHRAALAFTLPLLVTAGCLAPAAASAVEPVDSAPRTDAVAMADDTTMPQLSIDVPPVSSPFWYGTATTATITATDTGSGVKSIHWKVGNHPEQSLAAEPGQTTFTVPVIISKSGDYDLQYFAMDNAGNSSWRLSKNIRVDVDAPKIYVDSLKDGQYLRLGESLPLDFTIADMHSGMQTWSALLAGPSAGQFPLLVAPGEDLMTSAPGQHLLTFRAQDVTGHSSLTELHYAVSDSTSVIKTAPSVTFSTKTPKYNAPVSATIRVKGAGSASIPLGKVALTVDGHTYRAALVDGEATIPLSQAVSGGTRAVKLAFTSSTSHVFTSSTGTAKLTVAKAKPTVTAKPTRATVAAGSRAKVAVSATLPGTLGAKATGKVAVYDGKKKVGTGTLKNGKATITLAKLKRGTHRLTAKLASTTNHTSATSTRVTLRVK